MTGENLASRPQMRIITRKPSAHTDFTGARFVPKVEQEKNSSPRRDCDKPHRG
jgi:hypothetical protein